MRYFAIDLHRQLCKRLFCMKSKAWFFFIGTPVAIATLLMTAFMLGSAKYDKFLFFSTLYAFWIGLFGSCQTLNGEVASGEWSYWVLGNRLSIRAHLAAVTASSLLIAMVQLAFFVLTVIGFDFAIAGGAALVEAIVARGKFILHWPGASDPMFSTQGCLLLAVSIFGLSLWSSASCGVALGMLFSAIFRETAAAIRQAVAMTVLLCVVSATALERSSSFPLLRLWITPPRYSAVSAEPLQNQARYPVFGTVRPSALLEDCSFVLPQRYFFNIARVLNHECSRLNGDTDRVGSAPGSPYSLEKTFKPSALWDHIEIWTKNDADEKAN